MTKERVLSGLRPTGRLHVGHLKGALENWVRLQDDYDCYYTIVDWHALTTHWEDPSAIRGHVQTLAREWLACGLDPKKSTIFLQSDVKAHAELHLLFSMMTPLGWLERVPTYKEIMQQLDERELQTYGFLGYPVLQAADIAVYRGQRVPVGEDQVSHLELAREVVRRFNSRYGKVFPEPQPLLTSNPRLPGTDGRKMSKSYGNVIELADDPETTAAKIRTMVTDPARKRRTDPGNPEICPVFFFHKAFSPSETLGEVDEECRKAGIGCVDCKKRLAVHMNEKLAPIHTRLVQWEKRPDEVQDILSSGAQKARIESEKTMELAREAIFNPHSKASRTP